MIFLKRRRLIFWLVRAYIKKWRRTILLSFIFGLLVFFILRFGINYFIPFLPFTQEKTIGLVGAYTTDELPTQILSKVSKGLVYLDKNDIPKPDIASSWDIKNNGKTYIFYLKKNIYFSDGTKVTSDTINYNFSDVTVEKPNSSTIIFNLKSSYSPFLVTVSRPIFKNGFIGIGDYKVGAVNVNGNFVQSISLISVKGPDKELVYQFYPTEKSLKTAFILGEVSEISGVTNLNFDNKDMASFTNDITTKSTDYSNLVTLFLNREDKDLSDKTLGEALSYAIPDHFTQGIRNYGPFNPNSWVTEDGLTTYQQDLTHAKSLLSNVQSSSQSSSLSLTITTMPQYRNLAEQIKSLWESLGIKINIQVVNSLPSNFQVFLGEYNVPQDPDQYTLWHSSQMNNISNYKNLRIDKLLEDGRQTIGMNQRRLIYEDFQKYLLDDPPAIFLYFPYTYDITRK